MLESTDFAKVNLPPLESTRSSFRQRGKKAAKSVGCYGSPWFSISKIWKSVEQFILSKWAMGGVFYLFNFFEKRYGWEILPCIEDFLILPEFKGCFKITPSEVIMEAQLLEESEDVPLVHGSQRAQHLLRT